MDDMVKAAMAKWPNVPHCYGWLGLSARGDWYMRDDRAQAAGPFVAPPGTDPARRAASRGSLLQHGKLIDFIQRNYLCDPPQPGGHDSHHSQGRWFFQNGPQRVYVELEATPLIWRVEHTDPGFAVTAHTGEPARVQRCLLDEQGRVYLDTDVGFGLVHTLDMLLAADAIEQGLWVPQEVEAHDLPARFAYVRSPAQAHALA